MHCVLHAAEKALTTVCRKHPALFVCLATQGASVAWSCFLFFSLYFVKMPDWTHLHVCQEALLRAVVVLIVCVGVCSVRSLAPVFSRTHTAKYNIVLQNKNLARLFTASVCAFSAHRLLWHDFCFFLQPTGHKLGREISGSTVILSTHKMHDTNSNGSIGVYCAAASSSWLKGAHQSSKPLSPLSERVCGKCDKAAINLQLTSPVLKISCWGKVDLVTAIRDSS